LDLFESLPYAYTFSEKCGQNTLEKWFLRWLFVGSVYIVFLPLILSTIDNVIINAFQETDNLLRK
jgi:hypothetical protein